MSKTKYIVVSMLVFVLLFFSMYSVCYAVVVTKDNLNTTLQKFVSSDTNENSYQFTISDNVITITADGKNYTLNYDLTTMPTFSLEIPIQKGMSYANFKEQTDNIILPMFGYIATANIQGIEFEDASTYFLMSYLGNAFNGSWSSENSYVIVDDTNMSDGVTISKDENNNKTIYASEFGERVMEYVNDTYKNKQTITDAAQGLNSYQWTIERKDVTETSCKLVSSLSVNVDADFSKIKGYANQMGEAFLNKDITKDNADYPITLKVGQKCIFETTEKITDHEISGSGYDYKDVNENCIEITGKSVGKANGYIYVGETKKSFYITIESNSGNQKLEPIILKIGTLNGSNKPSEDKKEEDQQQKPQVQQTSSLSKDDTTTKGILPKAGVSNVIALLIIFSIISITIIGLKLQSYKDIR